MALSDRMKDCLTYLRRSQGFSDATEKNYGRTYRQFLAFLQERGLKDEPASFSKDNVLGFTDWLSSRNAVGNTILNKLHGLGSLASYLMERNDGRGRPLLLVNPTKGFKRPKLVQPETFYLLPDELRAYMGVKLPLYLDVARALLIDTGLRRLEACEANVNDLHEVEGQLYLTVKVKGRRAANAEPDHKPVSPDVAALINASLAQRGYPKDESPLLVTRSGHRFTAGALTCVVVRIGEKAGITRISCSPHRLRHTTNVIARRAGVDALTRAKMLGHKSLRTLARYDHLMPGETAAGRLAQRTEMDKYLRSANAKQRPDGDA
jgi:integrase